MSKIRMSAIIIDVIFIILTLAFIFGNSLQKVEESTNISDGVTNIVESIPPIKEAIEEEKITRDELDGAVRALAHVAEFFLLGAEAMLLVLLCSLRPIVAATFLPIFSCLAVGVIDESLQMLNDRSAQFVDIMKDFAGGVLGTLAIFAVYIIICKVKNKTK